MEMMAVLLLDFTVDHTTEVMPAPASSVIPAPVSSTSDSISLGNLQSDKMAYTVPHSGSIQLIHTYRILLNGLLDSLFVAKH